jgi:hypothetical protein
MDVNFGYVALVIIPAIVYKNGIYVMCISSVMNLY